MGLPAQGQIAFWSSAGVVAACCAVAMSHALGVHATHMILHIALMNVVAPLLAALIVRHLSSRAARPCHLWTAAAVQIVSLWIVHAPLVQNLALSQPLFQIAVFGVLS